MIEGIQALVNYLGGSFFQWDRGSQLLFWGWSYQTKKLARDGHPNYISGVLSTSKQTAKKLKPEVYPLLLKKLPNLLLGATLVSLLQNKLLAALIYFKSLKEQIFDQFSINVPHF